MNVTVIHPVLLKLFWSSSTTVFKVPLCFSTAFAGWQNRDDTSQHLGVWSNFLHWLLETLRIDSCRVAHSLWNAVLFLIRKAFLTSDVIDSRCKTRANNSSITVSTILRTHHKQWAETEVMQRSTCVHRPTTSLLQQEDRYTARG